MVQCGGFLTNKDPVSDGTSRNHIDSTIGHIAGSVKCDGYGLNAMRWVRACFALCPSQPLKVKVVINGQRRMVAKALRFENLNFPC